MHKKKCSLERLNGTVSITYTRRSLWAMTFIRTGTVPTREVMEAESL